MTFRNAIVTGGSTGIGKATAIMLAKQGWKVAFSYLHSDDEAAVTLNQLNAISPGHLSAKCDVGAQVDVTAFYNKIQNWCEAPDLLVNNAGTQTWAPLLSHSIEDWEKVLKTNLTGMFLNTKFAAQLMINHKKSASIVNIGSGCNKLAFPNLVSYTASKGGVEQFTKSAAIELGQYGIRVNCIAPGAIEIERTNEEDHEYAAKWSELAPLGRVGQGEDIAKAILFLATDASDYISGQTIWIDGGTFSRAPWPYRTVS